MQSLECDNNLKQIGLACHNYEGAMNQFPAAGTYPVGGTAADSYSVHARILRYVEQDNLYQLVSLVSAFQLSDGPPAGRIGFGQWGHPPAVQTRVASCRPACAASPHTP